jgi:hypothetical protein
MIKAKAPATPDGAGGRLYIAEDSQVGLMVAIYDEPTGVSSPSGELELLAGKMSFLAAANAHVLSEKKIALGAYPGAEFEAESSVFHISARFYLVDATLYKTAVFTPLGRPYADTTRFLDSFQLIPRTAAVGSGLPTVNTNP